MNRTKKIRAHKGGRTVKKSTDVTPETARRLSILSVEGESLGDIVEEAVNARFEDRAHNKSLNPTANSAAG